MNFKELLKKLNLTDEQITSIETEMVKEKIYITSLEKADERYSKLKADKENLDTQLKTANDTIEDLKKNSGNSEELKKKLEDYEKDKKKQEQDYKEKVKELALENELIKVNVNSVKSAKAELDMTKIIYDEEKKTFIGLSEQVESMETEMPWLFKSESKVQKKKYNPKKNEKDSYEGDISTLMKQKDFNLTEYLKQQGGIE